MAEERTILQVGLDDTDSPRAYCTTYATFSCVRELRARKGHIFLDYPLLVRLNPNVPWKTRGNGANAIKIQVSTSDVDYVKKTIIETVSSNSDLEHEKCDPAIVFLQKSTPDPSRELRDFYAMALRDIIDVKNAVRFSEEIGAHVIFLKHSNHRGVVGALAALGALSPQDDFTYELLVYRKKERWGQPRLVDPKSVMAMDEATRPLTFNNFDRERARVLVTPHGPDPVLAGIRGDNPQVLVDALELLKFKEGYDGWMLFRTNQATDAHLPPEPTEIASIKPLRPVKVSGEILGRPFRISGGHVVAGLKDSSGTADIVAYEQSGNLREVVEKLVEGDSVDVYGNPKVLDQAISINMEKLEVKELVQPMISRPPICPICNRRCKSKGTRQGYECEKCGYTDTEPELTLVRREVQVGIYLPPSRSQRHLTKPLVRYGRERTSDQGVALCKPWCRFLYDGD